MKTYIVPYGVLRSLEELKEDVNITSPVEVIEGINWRDGIGDVILVEWLEPDDFSRVDRFRRTQDVIGYVLGTDENIEFITTEEEANKGALDTIGDGMKALIVTPSDITHITRNVTYKGHDFKIDIVEE